MPHGKAEPYRTVQRQSRALYYSYANADWLWVGGLLSFHPTSLATGCMFALLPKPQVIKNIGSNMFSGIALIPMIKIRKVEVRICGHDGISHRPLENLLAGEHYRRAGMLAFGASPEARQLQLAQA